MKSIIASIVKVFSADIAAEPVSVHTVHVVDIRGNKEGVIYIPLERMQTILDYGFAESELNTMTLLKTEPFGEDTTKIWLETFRRDRKLVGVIDEHGMFTFRTAVKSNFLH